MSKYLPLEYVLDEKPMTGGNFWGSIAQGIQDSAEFDKLDKWSHDLDDIERMLNNEIPQLRADSLHADAKLHLRIAKNKGDVANLDAHAHAKHIIKKLAVKKVIEEAPAPVKKAVVKEVIREAPAPVKKAVVKEVIREAPAPVKRAVVEEVVRHNEISPVKREVVEEVRPEVVVRPRVEMARPREEVVVGPREERRLRGGNQIGGQTTEEYKDKNMARLQRLKEGGNTRITAVKTQLEAGDAAVEDEIKHLKEDLLLVKTHHPVLFKDQNFVLVGGVTMRDIDDGWNQTKALKAELSARIANVRKESSVRDLELNKKVDEVRDKVYDLSWSLKN